MESNAIPPPPPPPRPPFSTMNGSSEQQWYYPNYAADPTTAGGYGTDAAAMTTTGPDQNHGAVAVAPSETTTNGNTEEFARIVGSVAAHLERTRNHRTELEAWTSFASSQLAHHHHHHTVGVVNTTDLPASITDAWQAMAKAATKPVFDDDENVAMARNVRDEKTTAAAVMTSLGDAAESSRHMTVVTMPAGQQSIAVRNLVLTNSLKRMAVMAGEVMQQQQQQQQQTTNGKIPPPAPCIGEYSHLRPKEDHDIYQRIQHIPVSAGSAVFWDNR